MLVSVDISTFLRFKLVSFNCASTRDVTDDDNEIIVSFALQFNASRKSESLKFKSRILKRMAI